MLALRTGWTPAVIGGDAPGGVTDRFRRAAHMAMYAERFEELLRDAEQAANADLTGLTGGDHARVAKGRALGAKAVADLRIVLGLDDG